MRLSFTIFLEQEPWQTGIRGAKNWNLGSWKIEQIDFGTKGVLIAIIQKKPKNPKKLLELNLNNNHSKNKIRL